MNEGIDWLQSESAWIVVILIYCSQPMVELDRACQVKFNSCNQGMKNGALCQSSLVDMYGHAKMTRNPEISVQKTIVGMLNC